MFSLRVMGSGVCKKKSEYWGVMTLKLELESRSRVDLVVDIVVFES